MIKKTLFIILLTVAACQDPIVVCDYEKETISGEYKLETMEVDGDCGSAGTLNVAVESGVASPVDWAGCRLVSESWIQGSCTSKSVFECDDGVWQMQLEWSIIASVENAQNITGELYAEMSKWNGLYTCSSTYAFEGNKE
tara:strand:+ start:1198 stop:1617 length:420 start_codon:yes stop_codon:yes gene_type:complete